MPPEGQILYAPDDNAYMAAAFEAARDLSTEHNHPTGSVIVKNGEIIGRGGNQAALRHPTLIAFHKNMLCFRRLFRVKSGEKYWLCPGCASFAMHSEQQAVKDAKRKGGKTDRADLYLWGHWWCCEPCWNTMIEAGIRNVYLLEGSHELFNREHPNHAIGKHI